MLATAQVSADDVKALESLNRNLVMILDLVDDQVWELAFEGESVRDLHKASKRLCLDGMVGVLLYLW